MCIRDRAMSCRNMVTVTARIPNTPVLVRMPDSRALAGAGATGLSLIHI